MSYEQIRDFIVSWLPRVITSWVAKPLAFYGGYDTLTAKSNAEQVVAGILTVGVIVADTIHSWKAHKAALNTLPPSAVTSVTTDPSTGAVTTTAVQVKPGGGA